MASGELSELTETDLAMLAFERQRWNHPGTKEQAIKDLFDRSANAYYQRLNELIDLPAALQHDPQLVWRLRRLRTSRQRLRARPAQ